MTTKEYPHQYAVGDEIMFIDPAHPDGARIGNVIAVESHFWIVGHKGREYKVWKKAFDLPKGVK